MNDRDAPELDDLFRRIPGQRSPASLDDAILGAAARMAPRRRRRSMPGWMTVVATACVALVAILVVQPLQKTELAPPRTDATDRSFGEGKTTALTGDNHGGVAVDSELTPRSPPAPNPSRLSSSQPGQQPDRERHQAPMPVTRPEPAIATMRDPGRTPVAGGAVQPPSPAPATAEPALRSEKAAVDPPESRAASSAAAPQATRRKLAESAAGDLPPAPCSEAWFEAMAESIGDLPTASADAEPGSAAWRAMVAETLELPAETSAAFTNVAAWCRWVEDSRR